MPKHVLRNPLVTVNGVDLSNQARAVTITTSRPEVEVTTFGDSFQSFVGGIPDATIEVEYLQNFDAGKVDATHWPLVNSDTTFAVTVRDVNAAGSATNPTFFMNNALLLGDYQPIQGDVGSALTTTVTYRNAGTTGVVRHTT
jgi:hypothetical protein